MKTKKIKVCIIAVIVIGLVLFGYCLLVPMTIVEIEAMSNPPKPPAVTQTESQE